MGIGITEIAFVGYPVTDITRAKAFYQDLLGLEPTMDEPIGIGEGNTELRWIEYDIGAGTLALSNAWPPSGQSGPSAALEVEDLDAALDTLRENKVTFKTDTMESPVCRFAVVTDPDGNDLTIHQRKPLPAG